MTSKFLRIAVVGGGPLGLIYSALAADSGGASLPVFLISRQEALTGEGINVRFPDDRTERSWQSDTVRVLAPACLNLVRVGADIVFLLTRSDDSRYAVARAAELLAPDGVA